MRCTRCCHALSRSTSRHCSYVLLASTLAILIVVASGSAILRWKFINLSYRISTYHHSYVISSQCCVPPASWHLGILAHSQLTSLAHLNDIYTWPWLMLVVRHTQCFWRSGFAFCLYWQYVTATPACILTSHSTCLLFSSSDSCSWPTCVWFYRTRHFAVGTAQRPRTICCERVKATPFRLLLLELSHADIR